MELLPVPPADFCRRLYQFDKYLQLNFHAGQGCWQILRRDADTGQIDHVMNVVNPDGSFRELDERTFEILRRNRYYAENPSELIDKVVNQIERDVERDKKRCAAERQHMAKDKSLKKQWDNVVELAKSISWRDWLKPQGEKFIDKNGKVRHVYEPDKTVLVDPRKPTI